MINYIYLLIIINNMFNVHKTIAKSFNIILSYDFYIN